MKPCLIIFLLIASASQQLVAQDTAVLKKRISFRISVIQFDQSEARGWLANISDSSVQVSDKSMHFSDPRFINRPVTSFDYRKIDQIKLKRNNGAGRGAVIGVVCGFFVGAIAAFSAGDDPHVPPSQDFFGISEAFRMTATEKAAIGGFAGAVIGGGIGAIIGGIAKKTFIIGGKKEKFDEMRANVIDRAYSK